MYPHRIRLRVTWEIETAERTRTVRFPIAWSGCFRRAAGFIPVGQRPAIRRNQPGGDKPCRWSNDRGDRSAAESARFARTRLARRLCARRPGRGDAERARARRLSRGDIRRRCHFAVDQSLPAGAAAWLTVSRNRCADRYRPRDPGVGLVRSVAAGARCGELCDRGTRRRRIGGAAGGACGRGSAWLRRSDDDGVPGGGRRFGCGRLGCRRAVRVELIHVASIWWAEDVRGR